VIDALTQGSGFNNRRDGLLIHTSNISRFARKLVGRIFALLHVCEGYPETTARGRICGVIAHIPVRTATR
jgi:hypothetical protein